MTMTTTNPMYSAGYHAAIDDLTKLADQTRYHLATTRQASEDYADAWVHLHELLEHHGFENVEELCAYEPYDIDDDHHVEALVALERVESEIETYWKYYDKLPPTEQLAARSYQRLMRFDIAYENEAELDGTEIPEIPARDE